jgi:hypothetical protein
MAAARVRDSAPGDLASEVIRAVSALGRRPRQVQKFIILARKRRVQFVGRQLIGTRRALGCVRAERSGQCMPLNGKT